MGLETVTVELKLDEKLKAQVEARAALGFAEIESFLHDAAMGKVTETVVVDEWVSDPETGKNVRVKTAKEVAPAVKDRVGAAKAWKELTVDKTAPDKKEAAKPPGEKGAGAISDAIKDVAEKRRKAALVSINGGKALSAPSPLPPGGNA